MTPFERADHVEIGARLLAELRRLGDVVHDEGALYRYVSASGLFAIVDVAEQSRIIQSFAGAEVNGSKRPLAIKATDVGGAIKLAAHQAAQSEFFAHARRGLAFSNGFVEVTADALKLHPHAPEHRARIGYGFKFEETATAPKFTRFLCDLYVGDDDADDKIRFLQEFFGAALVGCATRYQLALVLLGEGANGKSALIFVIVGVMPDGSCCAIPPQEWANEYRRALLAGKLLNSVSELPEADIIASESVKAMITGDLSTARPIHKEPFTFAPKAGHVFAANRLPGSNDVTEGFWRRLSIVRHNRSFVGAEANPNLAQEILNAERPGVVRWMLDGAQRVLQQGRYTLPASSARDLIEWRRNANPVALFVEEMTRELLKGERGETASSVYANYESWCRRNGHRPLSSTKFGERMKLLGKPSASDGQARRHPLALLTGSDSTLTGTPSGQSGWRSHGYS